MKILYVTSETTPFAASGGLGDVMGALPKSVASMGHSCKVIMPLYNTMKDQYRSKLELVCDLTFKFSWRDTGASVYKLDCDGVSYLFVENHYYFDRGKLYGEFDDGERFAFFSRSVIEYMLYTGDIPDILHANDWQAATSIIYLKTEFAHIQSLSRVKTVYTIHNIEYQGKFDPYILGSVFGIDTRFKGVLEYDGCINLMKGAMVASDYITTVSPNYSNELSHDYFAFGLSRIVGDCRHKMSGVINGIDYDYFSPESGGEIYASYNTRTYKSGKVKNKTAFQVEVGLPVNADVPLVVMITRFASQKGIDLVIHILDELLCENVQVAILGTGDTEYENSFRAIESRHDNFKALIMFDRALSKKMYAAADIFMMPSKSEPCGLAQMIACSYGTVPVVRSVGGLFDTIRTYGEEGANGFRFDNYNAHELLFTLKAAIGLYHGNRKEWNKLSSSAKKSKFTWDDSAAKYIQIYNNLI